MAMTILRRSRPRVALSLLAAVSAGTAIVGCSGDPPKAVRVPVVREGVPEVLRGTIGAEATIRNTDPTLISGYGIVVGLNGTGGDEGLPIPVRTTLERELALMGVGKTSDDFRGTALHGLSPAEVLRRRDVAAVVVYALIPPAMPDGVPFDVYVRALSTSPDVSLEGGLLWTTPLRIGPPGTLGGYNTRLVGEARGEVFINPFSRREQLGISRNEGRILAGGRMNSPLPIELVMDNESHSRARQIVDAINTRFPQRAEDSGPAARGRNERIVHLRVPFQYRYEPERFVALVRHLRVDRSLPQEYAKRYVNVMRNEPAMTGVMSWCLEALGQAAVPFLRELYDSPMAAARLAALRAGAGLGDPLAAAPLDALIKDPDASLDVKLDAISQMGELDAGPTVDRSLRALLAAPSTEVRVVAYEALVGRVERAEARRRDAMTAPMGVLSPRDPRMIDRIPEGAVLGVSRRPLGRTASDRRAFVLDVIAGGSPLIYVTQQGQPRVVLFGESIEIAQPMIVSVWSDRLLMVADEGSEGVRVRYVPLLPDGRLSSRAVLETAPRDVPGFVAFMAHAPSPEDPRPGLGLSYSEVVGVLHALWEQGAIDADFVVQNDLTRARALRQIEAAGERERPETLEEAEELTVRRSRTLERLTEPQGPLDTPKPPIERRDPGGGE